MNCKYTCREAKAISLLQFNIAYIVLYFMSALSLNYLTSKNKK